VNRPDLTVEEADAFFQTAAVAYCADNDYDAGNGTCTICNDVESGALKFSTVSDFPCESGATAKQSMADAVSKMWIGGATAHIEAQCVGHELIVDPTCPSQSYAYFGFVVLQHAADTGDDGGLLSFGSIEDMCTAMEGSDLPDDGSLTHMLCEKYAAGAVDEDSEFEYRCAGSEDVITATFGDMWQAGHQRIDGYFDAICGEDELRFLSVDGHELQSEDKAVDFARMLWGSPPPPPSGGSLVNCCSNACFGRCGDGCSCWSWVCGDCNAHRGCFEHDWYCSCAGMWHPRCIAFMAWTNTCNWPGCAASKCGSTNTGYCSW